MTLIVFDMGRRIETPVKSPRLRINSTSPTSPVERTSADKHANVHFDLQHPIDQYEKSGHEPQVVAFAGDVMEKKIITVLPDTTITDAYKIMQENTLHHLPVTDQDEHLQAIVSDRDILKYMVQHSQNNNTTIIDIAIRPVFCVMADTDIRQTARLLCDYHIGALPVIGDDQKIVGIITRSDLLQLISHYGPLELWA